jgi:hypothetical protein
LLVSKRKKIEVAVGGARDENLMQSAGRSGDRRFAAQAA